MKPYSTAVRLKQIMKDQNIKQVDILNMCKPFCNRYNVKLGKNDLSQYVNGKVEPGQEKLNVLAEALNVSEAWLMGYDVPMDRIFNAKPIDNDRLNEFVKLCSELSDDELDIIETLIDSLLSKHGKED